MKKFFLSLPLLIFGLTALAGCGGYDYEKHLSETRSDIFCAETEEFIVTLSCISREHPFASDGVACPRADLMEVTLTAADKQASGFTVTVSADGTDWGGEMSFRNVRDDWFYSESTDSFPEKSVTIRIDWEGQFREIEATSVKNEDTMSVSEALEHAIKQEKTAVDARMKDGAFQSEFRVRLLRRDRNYYYVGIIDGDGTTISLLLDAESGEVLARRESDS